MMVCLTWSHISKGEITEARAHPHSETAQYLSCMWCIFHSILHQYIPLKCRHWAVNFFKKRLLFLSRTVRIPICFYKSLSSWVVETRLLYCFVVVILSLKALHSSSEGFLHLWKNWKEVAAIQTLIQLPHKVLSESCWLICKVLTLNILKFPPTINTRNDEIPVSFWITFLDVHVFLNHHIFCSLSIIELHKSILFPFNVLIHVLCMIHEEYWNAWWHTRVNMQRW